MIEPSSKKRVMIVDDSEIVLAVAQLALESAGFDVVTHPRPMGCIALILQVVPDLLLIDVNMPGLNGDTVVKMLGSTQSNSQMIVLLYSTLGSDILEEKAAASGAHGYIRKSESSQDLVRQVARWIRPHAGSGSFNFGLSPLREANDARIRSAARDAALSPARSNSRLAVAAQEITSAQCAGKILLVDQEMVTLSKLRKLVMSQPGPVEFALSGAEVLRRLQGHSPPDVVVLGTLTGPPSADDVLLGAARLSPRWKGRFIIVHDGPVTSGTHSLVTARLSRPVTEAALCGAIRECLQYAS
jgi:CheY-like chemotaxis protein